MEPDALRPAIHHTVPDRIQAATYLAAVAVSGGSLDIHGARPSDMKMLLERFADMGMDLEATDNGLLARAGIDALLARDLARTPDGKTGARERVTANETLRQTQLAAKGADFVLE